MKVSVPDKPKGRPGDEYYESLKRFADDLREVQSRLDFKMSARGWCYYLENEGVIDKGDFDWINRKITDLRKEGYLPIDFVASDESRLFDCTENVIWTDPDEFIEGTLSRAYEGVGYDKSFWETQDAFIQLLVEKIDLKELFKGICNRYNIPVATSKGWSSLRQRGKIARRFIKWGKRGKKLVLLYCGDFDPAGVQISAWLKKNLDDLEDALIPDENGGYVQGWTTRGGVLEGEELPRVEVDRFGLNADFIQEYELPWIDGLETGSGKDLSNPSHPDHDKEYVQDWLKKYGTRKVEANALVTNPQAGRELFEGTIKKHLGEKPRDEYESELEQDRKEIKNKLKEAGLEQVIERIESD